METRGVPEPTTAIWRYTLDGNRHHLIVTRDVEPVGFGAVDARSGYYRILLDSTAYHTTRQLDGHCLD